MPRFLPAIVLLILSAAAFAQSKPNIVLIMCDDLGYADIGVQGAKHKTPNIDQLAAEGMRLTSFYAAHNVCTPTRASIMTGCYARRVGLHENGKRNWVLFPGDARGISADEITLPELLKTQGYTTALVGKWHLGDQPAFFPTRHGFDEFFGIPYSNDMGKTEKPNTKHPELPLMKNEQFVDFEPDQRQLTRRLTDAALDFVKRSKDKPFFLYITHPMPHWPQFASENFAGKSGNGRYGDSVTEIDACTGELMKLLKDQGLDDKTLVVFLSDNGGPTGQGATNTPLRAAKGTIYEGGHRVPFIARWPGKIPAGKTSAEMGVSFDLYTTLAKVGGAEIPKDRKIDGKDLWPILSGAPGVKTPHEAFFYWRTEALAAVRSGNWKLVLAHKQAPQGKPDEIKEIPAALYNLEADLAEKTNVAAANPEVVNRLEALAAAHRADLGDGRDLGPGCRKPGEVQNPKLLEKP